ncbi:MAG: UDP-N-acetylmuramate dehydrogenase [Leptonema sp. (in: Bacteria)]|nr:UDP-N-acetylmuramate dehydrogenase [Leptonema sp. (in: bacteria)]
MAFQIQTEVDLAPLTTLQMGGKARYFVEVTSNDDLKEAFEYIQNKNLKYYILAGGSNTIFSDTGFNGIVVKMAIKGIDRLESNSQLFRVAAGERFDSFVQLTVDLGLSGLECLSGIPGSVGATPVQNVGAYGQEVKDTILKVKGMMPNGESVELSNHDCNFSYRNSRFKNGDLLVITYVQFQLCANSIENPTYLELKNLYNEQLDLHQELQSSEPTVADKLQILRESVISIRRRKSMIIDPFDADSRSAGSFFLNPILSQDQYEPIQERLTKAGAPVHFVENQVKLSAAWLVENSGFYRGYTENGVGISNSHSLALVNRGGSSQELLQLAEKIKFEVEQKFQVKLEQEPNYVNH